MMSKLEDNVNEILGLEKKTEVAVKDFEQPAPVPKKIDETKSDIDNDLIYLRGSIPGSKNTTVYLRESVKNITRKTVAEKYEAKLKKAEAKKGKK